jgi:ribosome-associated protein
MSDAEFPDHDPDIVSKSQLKREAHEIFDLGKRLVELPASQLATLALPDDIRDAVDKARRIRQHIARKRQLQYLAKRMRQIDVEPIASALDELAQTGRDDVHRLHRLEQWRDHLLDGGDAALTLLMGHRHDVDAQHLRQLLRQAHRERQKDKPPAAARKLFKYLRELDLIDDLPPLV